MEQNWVPSLAFVWLPENDGQPYHVTPNDPGGGTSYGVTWATWNYAVAHGYAKGGLPDAGREALAAILHALYWLPVRGPDLPTGVDMVVFNMAMLSGTGRAASLLQRAVGVPEDGLIGPVTLGAVAAQDPRKLVTTLTNRDEAFFAGLTDAAFFLHGWDRRVLACEAAALNLIGAPSTPTPAPPSDPPEMTEPQAVAVLEQGG